MYGTDRRYASEGRPRRHPAEDWRETGGGGDGGIALHLAGTALSFIIGKYDILIMSCLQIFKLEFVHAPPDFLNLDD